MEVRNVNEVPAFITKDSSEIREIMAYRNSGIAAQSLAQATVYPGQSTEEHYHPRTEEIYYIEKGRGRIRVNGENRDIGPGDAIGMLPGDVQRYGIRAKSCANSSAAAHPFETRRYRYDGRRYSIMKH